MFWVILGRIESILGQKSALPKLLKNTIVLCTYSVSNAYFTVLNVPNDRMTHPWCEHTHKHTHTHPHTHTHTRTHARTHAHTYIHTHSHTRTHTRTHTHPHTHSHTRTHTHTCIAPPDVQHDLRNAATQGHDKHTAGTARNENG